MVETGTLGASGELTAILESLRAGNRDIEGVAVLSEDGLLVAALLPPTLEDGLVQGLAAMLAGIGERAATELNLGPMEQIIVRALGGHAVLVATGARTILLVLTNADARLGLVLLEAARAASRIGTLL